MALTQTAKLASAKGAADRTMSEAGGAIIVALFSGGVECSGNGYARESLTGTGSATEIDSGTAALCAVTETATFTASGGAITFDQIKIYRANGTTELESRWIDGTIADGASKEIAVRFVSPKDAPSWQEYGVKADGTTDDATGVQRLANAVRAESGGGVAQLPAGVLSIESKIEIPNETTLAGVPGWGTKLKAPAGFTGNFIETKDYATHIADPTNQWSVEGYPCRPGVQDIAIDGSEVDDQGGFSVWENATYVAQDTRDADDRTAVAIAASGSSVRRIHVYQWPGTACTYNRGTGTLTGVSQLEDQEAAEIIAPSFNGVLAGFHVASGADLNIVGPATFANFRDYAFWIEGAAHNVSQDFHAYGGATSDVANTQGTAFRFSGTGHTISSQLQADAVRRGVFVDGNECVFNGAIVLKYLLGLDSSGAYSGGLGVEVEGYSNYFAAIRARNCRGGTTLAKIKATATDTTIGFLACDLSGGRGPTDTGAGVTAADVQANGAQILGGRLIVSGAGGAMANFTALSIGATGSWAPDGGRAHFDVFTANSPSGCTLIKVLNIGTGWDIRIPYRGSSVTPLSNPNGVSLTGNRIVTVNVDTGDETIHSDFA